MEEPLQNLVLQNICTINKSVLDVIINIDNDEDFAATTMVKKFGLQIEVHSTFYMIDFIEKKFEVKKTSLLLPKVKYKDASIKMGENILISSIGVFDYIKYHPPDHLRSSHLKFEDEFFFKKRRLM
ncbi:hypothetical protein QJS04_geneDACA012720 [Acorus gramineus]|uniref:Uncharacterized protein n=1 Tax=Acorus gramineus TaxID=55184 RepID=A0AAV9A0E9_ACOGR|nr:hypothetical protein QJS04_geneDACA012720 [Acorus gramineus]